MFKTTSVILIVFRFLEVSTLDEILRSFLFGFMETVLVALYELLF